MKLSQSPLPQIFEVHDIGSLLISANFTKKGLKVQMCSRVNSILGNSLVDIQYMYETAGINFKVHYLFGTLLKMLTPFQITNHLHPNDISPLVSFNANSENDNQRLEQGIKGQDLKLIPNEFQNVPKTKKKIRKNEAKTQSKEFQKWSEENELKAIKKNSRSLISSGQELKLVEWILSKIDQNLYVKHKDISRKAVSIANCPGFTASKKWINGFLNRYPMIHSRLSAMSFVNKGKRFDDLPNSDESDYQVKDQVEKEEDHFQDPQDNEDWPNDEGSDKSNPSRSKQKENFKEIQEQDDEYFFDSQDSFGIPSDEIIQSEGDVPQMDQE